MNRDENKVISYIGDKIKSGELTTGDRLPAERAIAETLGIGRNATREALSLLSGMGFIESRRGSGNYLSSNGGKAIGTMLSMLIAIGHITGKEICEYRRAMDRTLCELILEKGLTNGEELAQVVKTMKEEDGPLSPELDSRFHYLLAEATENRIMAMVMEALLDSFREVIRTTLASASEEETGRLVLYHEEIYEGLRTGDVKLVALAIDKHYELTSTLV